MVSEERSSWSGRWTVQAWFQLVLAVMVVLVLLGAAAGAQVINTTMRSSDRLSNQLQPAMTQAYRLQAALVNQETGVRGYAIAAEPSFLDPYTAGRDEQARATEGLRALLAAEPALLSDLDAVLDAAEAWRGEYAEPLIAGAGSDARGAAGRARETAEASKNAFDTLRARFSVQNRDLESARDAARADLAHTRTLRDTVLTGLVALFVVTALILTVLVRRLIARPLARLETESLRVAGGEFDHHIHVHGPADLATVARAVEGMRRQLVAELASSREKEAVLARQAHDLDVQAVELRRSNTELEQFAYVASHDLQEPLRKVAAFCQLLEKRYGEAFDERGRQYIDYAVDGAKRMQVLINDLLTFSRVGRVNDAVEPVALDTTLDTALANLATVLDETGTVVHRPASLPEIDGDPTLLAQLWQNLIGNAVKFAAPGRSPVIDIDYRRCDGEHRISVTDNGIGIAQEFAEKVFVIFQRLHNRETYTGTGIGLAICRKIVEFHRGRIWIDTTYTDGARFCFTLPDTPTATTPDEPATAAEQPTP